jgi:hypothetical protein
MASFMEIAPREGRVRWRRFAAILVPAIVAAGVLVLLTAQSVIAVSLSISGTPFTVTAKQLDGRGFEQFGIVDMSTVNNLPGGRNRVLLTSNAIRSAKISHLCQSVKIGGLSLVITAGDGRTPVSATDLVVDADRLSGSTASFTNISIGQDASTLTEVPGITGPAGEFAQQAATITITDLRQHAYATTAGTFTLPGFRLRFGGSC